MLGQNQQKILQSLQQRQELILENFIPSILQEHTSFLFHIFSILIILLYVYIQVENFNKNIQKYKEKLRRLRPKNEQQRQQQLILYKQQQESIKKKFYRIIHKLMETVARILSSIFVHVCFMVAVGYLVYTHYSFSASYFQKMEMEYSFNLQKYVIDPLHKLIPTVSKEKLKDVILKETPYASLTSLFSFFKRIHQTFISNNPRRLFTLLKFEALMKEIISPFLNKFLAFLSENAYDLLTETQIGIIAAKQGAKILVRHTVGFPFNIIADIFFYKIEDELIKTEYQTNWKLALENLSVFSNKIIVLYAKDYFQRLSLIIIVPFTIEFLIHMLQTFLYKKKINRLMMQHVMEENKRLRNLLHLKND